MDLAVKFIPYWDMGNALPCAEAWMQQKETTIHSLFNIGMVGMPD